VGEDISAPVQTGSEASYTMGTGSCPESKRPGRVVDHPPTSSTEVKERVELYLYSPCGPSWLVLGLTFTLQESATDPSPQPNVSLLCYFEVCFNIVRPPISTFAKSK
jgi:hypothetical protein